MRCASTRTLLRAISVDCGRLCSSHASAWLPNASSALGRLCHAALPPLSRRKECYPLLGLSQDEIIAQCVMFVIAGYDSTSSTLGILCYNLALNPECQEKLIQEIDQVAGGTDELTYETLTKCTYLDQVISESLRLCPPGVRIERTCAEDYKLGDTGITIPKGMIVTIPSFCIHSDPEYYPNPSKFDPERFTPENKAKRHPFAYFPFGGGPRNCIGMRFALLEIKLALIKLFRKFRFLPSPSTKIPLEFYFGQQIIQPKEIILKVELRTDV